LSDGLFLFGCRHTAAIRYRVLLLRGGCDLEPIVSSTTQAATLPHFISAEKSNPVRRMARAISPPTLSYRRLECAVHEIRQSTVCCQLIAAVYRSVNGDAKCFASRLYPSPRYALRLASHSRSEICFNLKAQACWWLSQRAAKTQKHQRGRAAAADSARMDSARARLTNSAPKYPSY
jgi:hypothetical protein